MDASKLAPLIFVMDINSEMITDEVLCARSQYSRVRVSARGSNRLLDMRLPTSQDNGIETAMQEHLVLTTALEWSAELLWE